MQAVILDRASEQLKQAIAAAAEEIQGSTDPNIRTLRPSEFVWKKIQAGEPGLHDPENAGDMLILTMASWE